MTNCLFSSLNYERFKDKYWRQKIQRDIGNNICSHCYRKLLIVIEYFPFLWISQSVPIKRQRVSFVRISLMLRLNDWKWNNSIWRENAYIIIISIFCYHIHIKIVTGRGIKVTIREFFASYANLYTQNWMRFQDKMSNALFRAPNHRNWGEIIIFTSNDTWHISF
jgi:hypothetical protein